MKDFIDVIDIWPSCTVMATEVGANAEAVRKWRQRNRIPSEFWAAIISAAAKRGVAVSSDELVRFSAKRTRAV